MEKGSPSLLARREIEALALAPVIRAFGREIGWDRAVAVIRQTHEDSAREFGRRRADELGANTLAALAEEVRSWGQGGALEKETVEQSETRFVFKVTRCRFAERYGELGLRELGYCLSCCRDAPFVEGFNPAIRLTRTQTIMEGAPFCDFSYTLEG